MEALVASWVGWRGITFESGFSKTSQDWELKLVNSDFELLYSVQIRVEEEDIMCWKMKRNDYLFFFWLIMRH